MGGAGFHDHRRKRTATPATATTAPMIARQETCSFKTKCTIGSIRIGTVAISVADIPTLVYDTEIKLSVIPKNGPRKAPRKVSESAFRSLK